MNNAMNAENKECQTGRQPCGINLTRQSRWESTQGPFGRSEDSPV